jgi:hypothetical protein
VCCLNCCACFSLSKFASIKQTVVEASKSSSKWIVIRSRSELRAGQSCKFR